MSSRVIQHEASLGDMKQMRELRLTYQTVLETIAGLQHLELLDTVQPCFSDTERRYRRRAIELHIQIRDLLKPMLEGGVDREMLKQVHALDHELADLADLADMADLVERGRARMN